MTPRRVLLVGLVLLGLPYLAWGVSAVAAPRWFFHRFPGGGLGWTAAHPPYNEHLMVDVGAAFLAFGVLLLLAAALADRRVTAVVLVGVLIFSAVHLVYHAWRPGELAGDSRMLSLVALLVGVVMPVGLLWLNRRVDRTTVT